MNKEIGIDFTRGNILKQLLYFSIPVLIGNLLSSGYSIINVIWIGHLLDKNSIAALGVCMPIIGLMIALANGFSNAISIMISTTFGSNDNLKFNKTISISWLITFVSSILVVMIGILFSKNILLLINTPEEILDISTSFLKIQFFSYLFFHISQNIFSLLRGIGITIQANVILILSVVLYAVLDPILIDGFIFFGGFGLNGSAYAYIISLILASLFGLIYLKVSKKFLLPKLSFLKNSKRTVIELLKLAIPLFLQQLFVVMTTFFITAFVNNFGTSATAAYAIVSKIDTIMAMLATPLLVGMASFVGQNRGAGDKFRIKKSYKYGAILNLIFALPVWIVVLIYPENLVNIFTSNKEVIEIGKSYLNVVGTGYFLFSFMYVATGIINGMGKTKVTMFFNFISLCIIRIPFAWIIYRTEFGIQGIWFVILGSMLFTTVCLWGYVFVKNNRCINI
jgi:putative MATE family efflux protein